MWKTLLSGSSILSDFHPLGVGYTNINFAAPGTGGTVRKGVDPVGFFPQHNYISAITQAANCVVTVTWALPSTNFPVGSKWRFNVPAVNGMVEIDGLLGTVLAASDVANTVTFDIDTTGFTAVAGEGYFCNTTSTAFTATLPSSPALGDECTFVDYAGTFDTNNLTVGRNSEKINGAAADLTVGVERAAFTLVYTDGTQGWLLKDK